MEYLSFTVSPPKPEVSQFIPKIQLPQGNGMSSVASVPVPQSGMDRAEWWAAAVDKVTGPARDTPVVCSYDRKNAFGSNERTVMGNVRDDVVGAMTVAGYTSFMWDDETTKQADAVSDAYMAQVTATNGFWDNERDMVWVSDDVTTIWS